MKLNSILKYNNWQIRTKIMSISVVTIVLVLSGLMFALLPIIEKNLMNEKTTATKSVVESTYCVITKYHEMAVNGEISEEQAKAQAMATVKNIRYNGKEYFWINSDDLTMIMHPIKPKLDGKSVSELKDANGKYIFREMVAKANSSGEGMVDYFWPKPGSPEPEPKVSYIKYFQPWGWILGSGIYVDDVEKQISMLQWEILGGASAVLALVLLIAYVTASRIAKSLLLAVDITRKITQGDLRVEVNSQSQDETGQLLMAMKKMVSKLRDMANDIRAAAD